MRLAHADDGVQAIGLRQRAERGERGAAEESGHAELGEGVGCSALLAHLKKKIRPFDQDFDGRFAQSAQQSADR